MCRSLQISIRRGLQETKRPRDQETNFFCILIRHFELAQGNPTDRHRYCGCECLSLSYHYSGQVHGGVGCSRLFLLPLCLPQQGDPKLVGFLLLASSAFNRV